MCVCVCERACVCVCVCVFVCMHRECAPCVPAQVDRFDMNFSMQVVGTTATSNSLGQSSQWAQSSAGSSWWSSATSTAKFVSKSQSSSQSTVTETYHLDVRIRAGQGEVPKGLAILLDLLESGFIDGLDTNPSGVVGG